LGTDEKHIRAQSTILDKIPALSFFMENTVGARERAMACDDT